MSNIYNQQLSQALTAVNSSLQQNELTESNIVESAKLGLYHAHGLTSKTESQLAENQQKSVVASEQNKVSSTGVTATQNIVTASNAALIDASNTTSSASASAASIQKAATALTNLWGNVATTMAVASSLDNGSKIQRLVGKASRATQDAAALAEEASLIALSLTVEASQSRAAGVVTQATAVKGNTVALQKSLSDTYGKLQTLLSEDMAAVSDAITSENTQSGIYKTARAEDNALRSSEAFINKHINHNLTSTIPGMAGDQPTGAGPSGDQFSLSFNAFTEVEDKAEIINEYRLILVKEDEAPAFTAEFAKAIPSPSNYESIKPTGASSYRRDYATADYAAAQPSNAVIRKVLAKDYNGMPVVRGVPYVPFVYVVYSQAYQTHYNDTNGVLSQPGPVFTLATSLPVVATKDTSMIFFKKDEAAAVRIAFKMPAKAMEIDDIDLNQLMEFRAFIFNSKDKSAMALNLQIDAAADELYRREQVYRAAEEKYQADEQAYNTAVATGASKQEQTALKNQLIISKAQYQNARGQYNDQIKVIDQLSQTRINDFRVDESILESIPAAYYMTAQLNKDLPEDLKKRIDKLAAQRKDDEDQLSKNEATLKEKEEKAGNLNLEIETLLKTDDPKQAEIDETRKKLAEKIAQFQERHNAQVVINTSEEATSIRDNLGHEQKDLTDLLNEIIELFKERSTTEVSEIDLSQKITESRNQLKKVNTEIILLRSQQQILQDEIDLLSDEFDQLEAQATFIGGKDDNFLYYEVEDTTGDFTDNYGEPLVNGNSYCALILSAIKDSEPDAAPLYMNRSAEFSADVPFKEQA